MGSITSFTYLYAVSRLKPFLLQPRKQILLGSYYSVLSNFSKSISLSINVMYLFRVLPIRFCGRHLISPDKTQCAFIKFIRKRSFRICILKLSSLFCIRKVLHLPIITLGIKYMYSSS